VGAAQARVAAVLLLTLRGTPTLYNGDEIGMHDVPIPATLVQDPFEKNVPGIGVGRDPERTPLQWTEGPNAGFTDGKPWLPIADDFRQINVTVQARHPGSMLTLHRRLIGLRRDHPALAVGDYRHVHTDDDLFVYDRVSDGEHFRIALNFSHEPRSLDWAVPEAQVVLSTHLDRDGEVGTRLDLRAGEAVVARC
jgi:alpha-glucosidase